MYAYVYVWVFFFHVTRERYERVYIKLFMVITLSIELEGI